MSCDFRFGCAPWHTQVQFDLNEVSYSFEMETHSAFAADGVVRTVSSNGNRDSHPQHERVHTYRVREGDVHARALVSDSGEVRGLFRQGEVVVYLEPSKNPEGEPATGVWHDLYILAGPSTAPNRTSSGSRGTSTPSLRGSVASVEASESNVFTSDGTADPSWAGDRFYPGCYPGDSTMHSMKLRIYTDVQVHNEHPGQVQSLVESAILSASYVYENQLNVELLVEELIIYTDAASAPDWAKDCDDHGEGTFMDYKFNHVYDENKEDVIAMQAFTGCGTGSGWVGVAWVGTTCDIFNGPNGIGRYNFGLNQLQDAGDWLTFAHELGHNLGADHAFDEGQGSTGGIMDYYVGGIHDGVVQFNVDYTKDELCATFTNMGISCPAEQWFENPTTSTTSTTTAAPPTTTTTTAATTPLPITTTTAAQTQPTTTTTTAAPPTTTTTTAATTPAPTTTTTAAQTQPTTTTTTAAPPTTTTTTAATTPPPTTTTTAAQTQPTSTTTTTTAAPLTTTTTTVATTPLPTTTTTAAQTQPTTTTTTTAAPPTTTTTTVATTPPPTTTTTAAQTQPTTTTTAAHPTTTTTIVTTTLPPTTTSTAAQTQPTTTTTTTTAAPPTTTTTTVATTPPPTSTTTAAHTQPTTTTTAAQTQPTTTTTAAQTTPPTTTTMATTPPPTTTTTAAQTQPTTTTTAAQTQPTTTTTAAQTPSPTTTTVPMTQPPTTTTTAAQTQPTTTTTAAQTPPTTTTSAAATSLPTTTTSAAATTSPPATTTAASTTTQPPTTSAVATTPPQPTTAITAQTSSQSTTTAAITPPATTTAIAGTTSSRVPGGWEVSGDCTRDEAEPQCIQSPNYPKKYSDGQQCTIQVLETSVPIKVDFFNVHRKDAMIIDGTKYTRRNGPDLSGLNRPNATTTWDAI